MRQELPQNAEEFIRTYGWMRAFRRAAAELKQPDPERYDRIDPELIKAQRDSMNSIADEMEEKLDEYARVRTGNPKSTQRGDA